MSRRRIINVLSRNNARTNLLRNLITDNLNFSGTVTGSWDGEERAVPMIMPDSGDGEERVSIRLAAGKLENPRNPIVIYV